MSGIKIKNASVLDFASGTFVKSALAAEDGKICSFDFADDSIDFCGDMVIPGLVDAHTHGRCGYDFNSASVEDMLRMKSFYAVRGVTTVVPTLASDTFENLVAAAARIRDAGPGAVHIEGRYLNPDRRGAHNMSLISSLCVEEINKIIDAAGNLHVHVSAAYELDLGYEFLGAILARGGSAALAHTNATYAEAEDALSHGVCAFSHLFNGMPAFHHRAGGAAAAGLLSDAYVEIICDGLHLAPEVVRLVSKVKDGEKIVLVSDSMEGTASPDGEYSIAGNPVTVRSGRAYTADGTLAGSTLELLCAVRNYADFCSIPFEEAVRCASANPAAMLGMTDIGKLTLGARADFVRLAPDFSVKEVYIGGEKLAL